MPILIKVDNPRIEEMSLHPYFKNTSALDGWDIAVVPTDAFPIACPLLSRTDITPVQVATGPVTGKTRVNALYAITNADICGECPLKRAKGCLNHALFNIVSNAIESNRFHQPKPLETFGITTYQTVMFYGAHQMKLFS